MGKRVEGGLGVPLVGPVWGLLAGEVAHDPGWGLGEAEVAKSQTNHSTDSCG
jgi:hypothetical protein